MKSTTFRLCSRILFVAILLIATVSARAADPDWQPKRTWVFAVGVLEWQAKSMFGSFPKKDRRDAELVAFFRKQGVPAEQIAFIVDKQATKKHIEATFQEMLGKTRDGDLLLFYYAGHGVQSDDAKGATCLANYDMTDAATGLSVPWVIGAIEKDFKGSRVLLTADCCHSGALGVEAGKKRGRIAYATLTSVHPAGTSTGNWTFTESLLKGFAGDPIVDSDGDGKITFDELAKYTQDELAFAEGQLSHAALTRGFDGATALAITEKTATPGTQLPVKDRYIEAEWKGDWYKARVMQRKGDESFITYLGFGSEWDEWVKPARVRPITLPTIPAKTPVQVEWNGKWWKARVLDNKLGLHLVHYEGFGAEWDEWVGPKRVKVTN